MTTYTWAINNLQVLQNPEPNTVVLSNFTLLGVDGDAKGFVTYSVELLPADPANFVPYDQITEALAIQWTQAALGPERIASMEQEVQVQIDNYNIPVPQPAPLPWSE